MPKSGSEGFGLYFLRLLSLFFKDNLNTKANFSFFPLKAGRNDSGRKSPETKFSALMEKRELLAKGDRSIVLLAGVKAAKAASCFAPLFSIIKREQQQRLVCQPLVVEFILAF